MACPPFFSVQGSIVMQVVGITPPNFVMTVWVMLS